MRSQFAFSAVVAIGVRNSLNHGTQRTSGVSILRLAGDVPAAIVIIDPRRILMRIVHSNQLSQCIIDMFY